jgi:hypothetical protein
MHVYLVHYKSAIIGSSKIRGQVFPATLKKSNQSNGLTFLNNKMINYK